MCHVGYASSWIMAASDDQHPQHGAHHWVSAGVPVPNRRGRPYLYALRGHPKAFRGPHWCK
jgi:hypothetical protein